MKYPEYIMRSVRQRFGLEPDDTSRDKDIDVMSPIEVFDEWLGWQGIIGYCGTILSVVEDIFGVEITREMR